MCWKTKTLLTCLRVIVIVISFASGAMAVTESVPGIRESVVKKIQKAQVLYGEEDYAGAMSILDSLKSSRLKDYERAQVLNVEGYILFSTDKVDRAAKIFEEILSIDGIPIGLKQTVYYTLAQLYLSEGKNERCLETVEQLIAVAKVPEPDYHILHAQVLYQLKRYQPALTSLDRAFAMAAAKEKAPKENWLLVKNAVFYELDRYTDMVKVLRELLRLYPRDRYLNNLAAIYSQLEMQEKQLALLEPLYEAGRLKQSHSLVNLASLYMSLGTPYKGAKLLQQALDDKLIESKYKNWELLGKAWQMARHRDKAIGAYLKAAELSKDGGAYLTLAHLYISDMRWKQADIMLGKALEKGGLRSEGDANLLRGMALVNLKNYAESRRAFIKALDDEKNEAYAQAWLNYLEIELEKLDTLAEARKILRQKEANL